MERIKLYVTQKATSNVFLEYLFYFIFIFYVSAIKSVTTLVVAKLLEVFLAYGRNQAFTLVPFCSNVACMITPRIQTQLNIFDCYIASYGNNETNGTVTSAVSCGTSHVSAVKHTTSVDLQTRAIKSNRSCTITPRAVCLLENGE